MAEEIHIELLLGRKVVASNGRPIGRIEEICAEERDGEWVVTEYLLGAYAVLERLSVSAIGRATMNLLRLRSGYRVPWDKLDLADLDHPRVTCSITELEQFHNEP